MLQASFMTTATIWGTTLTIARDRVIEKLIADGCLKEYITHDQRANHQEALNHEQSFNAPTLRRIIVMRIIP